MSKRPSRAKKQPTPEEQLQGYRKQKKQLERDLEDIKADRALLPPNIRFRIFESMIDHAEEQAQEELDEIDEGIKNLESPQPKL